MRPSRRVDKNPPPKVKAFIQSVTNIPLEEIETPLVGFEWDFEDRGHFHHWTELFTHFNLFLSKYVSPRKDLQLSDDMLDEKSPFPKSAVLQILRVLTIIFEHCRNKGSFNGIEHFTHLLSSNDPDILLAALHALAALVRINPSKIHLSGKTPGTAILNRHVLALSQGWGSKEEGLGLFSCISENGIDETGKTQGSTLHFEFYSENRLNVIHISDSDMQQKDDDLLLMKELVEKFQVPKDLRFSLWTRIRYARAFGSLQSRRQYTCLRLLAFMVLVQSTDNQEELGAFFANDTEFMNDIIKVLQAEGHIPDNIRSLSMWALGYQYAVINGSHDRARIPNFPNIPSNAANRMFLLSLLQKAVMSLANLEPYPIVLVEGALYFFLAYITSSSTSPSPMRETGLIPALLPLLKDSNPAHRHLVVLAVRILQKFMDYSSPAISLFRDLGGIESSINRLYQEVTNVIELSTSDSSEYMMCDEVQQIPLSQRRLLKALLKELATSYVPTARSLGLDETCLPSSLLSIFRHSHKFGGDIFASAVTLMSEIIHKDPTCFQALHDAGLTSAFLDAIKDETILPSSKAIYCIPGGLDAICLNSTGLEQVTERNVLDVFVSVFTSSKFLVPLNEGCTQLANSMEELMRHVPSLRKPGVDVIVGILEKIAAMSDTTVKGRLDSPVPMDTDSDEKSTEGHRDESAVEKPTSERFLQVCISHAMFLVQGVIGNPETCKLFVEKKGIDALLKFFTLESIPLSSEWMSIAVHMVSLSKVFSQQHSSAFAKAFCGHLREHLRTTFDCLDPVCGSDLLSAGPNIKVFKCLFVVLFFVFLADATRENRWFASLMSEFGNDSKDVLLDVGRLHREILWQVALLESTKAGTKTDEPVNSVNSESDMDTSANEGEEHLPTSVRQYVDLILNQHRQSSALNSEPQLFDLLQLVYDIGHRPRIRRLNIDSSRGRVGIAYEGSFHPSEEGPSRTKADGNRKKSLHLFCHEILRSLQFYVSHLFAELGKTMHHSRRREEPFVVNPSSKSVASIIATIVQDDLNFEGYPSSGMDNLVSIKCCFLGKVVDLIQAVIVDKQESCNAVIVNYFYAHGVISSVLTTFEATTQLLWTLTQAPEAMESEFSKNKGSDRSVLFGTLSSYAGLMVRLCTPSFLLVSSSHLLIQPVTDATFPLPKDPEKFVKVLQSQVLKVVLPVWCHPLFSQCDVDFVNGICQIMKYVCAGVDVKVAKSAGGTSGSQVAGPPLNETSISTIVEMGFTRSRAEEALRTIRSNRVELAMEWLFSHPEEASQEDDELARALALSLGSNDQTSKEESSTDHNDIDIEEEVEYAPPIEEIFGTCVNLLDKDSLAFTLKDLLLALCTHNEGQERNRVISFLVGQLKYYTLNPAEKKAMVQVACHILALIQNEDNSACDVASGCGVVNELLQILLTFYKEIELKGLSDADDAKFITPILLALDGMLQLKKSKKISASDQNDEKSTGADQPKRLDDILDMPEVHMTLEEQKNAIDVVCDYMKIPIHSSAMQALLQLCAKLTRVHEIALLFLEKGGLVALLNLPANSLFPGFDTVASTIIRHILEDPHTLQLAMESEIRHCFISSSTRSLTGRLSPRSFLSSLSPVISRDPIVFMRAAEVVCQIEMVGERPCVVLCKEKDKEKSKEKEKNPEKEKNLPGDKEKVSFGGSVRISDVCSKAKGHKRPPQTFGVVVEQLLDAIIQFTPPEIGDTVSKHPAACSVTDMDVDDRSVENKGKSVVSTDIRSDRDNVPFSLALASFLLKMLTEIVLMYQSAVNVVIRRDTESGQMRGHLQSGASGGRQHGLICHVLHTLLPSPVAHSKDKDVNTEWRQRLSSKASQFLLAICVRSSEGRRRIFQEIVNSLNGTSASSLTSPDNQLNTFIDLVNDVLGARSPTGSNITTEVSKALIDVGIPKALSCTLQNLDLDHPDSVIIVDGIVKALESLTMGQIQNSEENQQKDVNEGVSGSNHDDSPSQRGEQETLSADTASHQHQNERASHEIDSFQDSQLGLQSTGNDDDSEEDFMTDSVAEDVGMDTAFNSEHGGQDTLVDEDDEDMSGDERDEDGEDEDEEDIEEDELDDDDDDDDDDDEDVHELSHPDPDNEDDHDDVNELGEDEYDEVDFLEDGEDDDDDDDEGNFILRLEDGMDVLEHFDILGRSDGDFPTDPFHVMHIEEVLGANRRQGRTTSIYNLLGRTEDRGTAFQHPLLASPGVSSRSTRRGIENDRTATENNADSTLASQGLDSIFCTLRNARPGNRMSSWADDSQQHGGLSGNAMAVAIEEQFVQRLQQAHPPEETGQAEPQNDETSTKEAGQQGTESVGTENVSMSEDQRNAEDQSNNERTEGNNNSNMDNDSTERVQIPSDEPSRQAGAANNDIEMVEERSERVMRDAEGISQDSGGSGATLGESLRSLEVEIGSVDGREEGTERVPNADTHSTRTQPLERNQQPTAGDQVSNAGASSDQTLPVNNAEEQQQNTEPNSSSSIDPTFLEALPEEIRTEVLASQRSQAVQSTSNPSPTPEEIDPEFLAALPPDIRAEVLAQQHAQRLLQSHQIDGQPVDMDSASILATFPPDIRAEVLLQSSDAVLANLPETLVSEAQRLRDSLRIGSNSDRLTSFRRGRRNGPGGVRSGALGIESHRAVSDKMIEPDGKPLLDTSDLKALLRILRIVQSIYKGSLQRLLLNICSYSSSRVALVQLLLEILLPSSEDACGSTQLSTRERNETTHRLYGCLGDFYSRPQFSDGIPPLVSRRVLETLTNLSQNHPLVANDLLYLKPMDLKNSQGDQQLGHGKAVATEDVTMMNNNPTYPIVLLLNLLNQPLYSRSSVHLEQLLGLVKVILNNVELNKLPVPQTQPGDTDLKPSTEDVGVSKLENSNEKDSQDPCSSSTRNVDAVSVLSNLSETELRLLSSMLAFEGLSELAYSHVSEILMKLVKVVPSHRHLLILQFSSSVEGLSMNAILELKSFGDVESMPLSTPVFGTAILRILQTLSSLSSSEDGRNEKISESENDENIAMIGNLNTSLEPLWSELSYCISKIESRTSLAISSSYVSNGVMAPLPPGTQKILPYVEAFFVTCEKLQSDQAAATQFELAIATASEVKEAASSSDSIMPPKNMVTQQKKLEEKGTTLIKFVEKHRRLLNAFVRQNPGLLEKSFSLLLRVPRLIEFDNKRAYFRSKIRQNQDHQNYSSLRITVRRAYILEDSFNQLRTKQPRELKGRLNVHFQGEEGIDAGGLTREWYQLLSRVIFDKGALLFTTVGNEATFQPNPNSVYQTEHLSYFKFVGRVVAKALFDGQLLDVHFTRSFYKHILGSKVTYHDIEAIDPDYYKNLKWMLENDIRDMPDLTFSMDADEEKLILYEREEVTDHELIPEGRNTRVTEENKHEYVDLVAEHRLTTAIRPQINAFLEGFNELISKDLISIFNDKELELLISGLPEIDLDDLRENTEYTGYSASSPVIQWYWEVVYKFSKEDKARLLQFVTGTSKVPLEGFKALQGITGLQRFQIHKAYGSPDRLPSAHTCFNQLDLPEYTTKEQLEERLLLAIHEGSEGFGFG